MMVAALPKSASAGIPLSGSRGSAGGCNVRRMRRSGFEIAGQEVILPAHTILEGLVPALDLVLGFDASGRPEHGHALASM